MLMIIWRSLNKVALGEATENDFLLIWKEENAESDVSMTRRVAFHKGFNVDSSTFDPKGFTMIKMPELGTFINFDHWSIIGRGFLLLRVLDLCETRITDLPTNLKNMIHLRYLGLRWTDVTIIPLWIDHLQNLQTFDIRGTTVKELPKSPDRTGTDASPKFERSPTL